MLFVLIHPLDISRSSNCQQYLLVVDDHYHRYKWFIFPLHIED